MKKYDSVMVDLETMGCGNQAAILSIGAFKFNLNDVQEYEQIENDQKFYIAVDLKSCERYGLEIDADTVMWWLKQDKVAQNALDKGIDLKEALNKFRNFVSEGDYYLWGNGSTFDNVILRNAFNKCKTWFPIKYKNDMCYRTMKTLFDSQYKLQKQYGTKHNALDDAITQGLHLQRICKILRGDNHGT